jgi:hypothetical protein
VPSSSKFQEFLILPALAYGGLASDSEPGNLHPQYAALGTAANNVDLSAFKAAAKPLLTALGFHDAVIDSALDSIDATNASDILPAIGVLLDNQVGQDNYPIQGCTGDFQSMVANAGKLDKGDL